MATPQTTYFGDLNVTGNTTLSGNLTVLGSFAYFVSNLIPASDGQSTIGPVGTVYVGGANTAPLNVTSISNGIGIGTSVNSGTALNVLGNLIASNALQTPLIRVTTANVGRANVTAIFSPSSFVGLNTTGPSGTSLYVPGFANASVNTLTPNVQISNLNVTTLNAFTFAAASNLGIGTGPTSGGPTLRVFGNVFGSNALQTVNVLATTVNVTTANILSITGPVGLAGPALPHANLAVYGNVAVSNGFTTPALNASAAGTVSGILNVTSLVTGSNLGIGTTPVSGGPALHVIGNVVVSNTFSAPDTFTSSWNISGRANTLTVTASKDFLVGGTTAGANVSVTGNAFVSNSVQTTNAFATAMNTTTINTASIISPIISVNGTSPLLYSSWSGSFDPISSQNLTTTSITGSPQLKTNSDPSGSGPSLGLNDGSSYIVYNFSPAKFIDLYNGGITYMTWLKINQTGNDYFLTFRSIASTDGWSLRLYRDSGTNLIVRASKGGGTAAANITGITNGVWRHIAVSFNAFNDDTLRLYVNGTQVDTGGLASTNRPPASDLINQNFSIGETGSGPVTDADFAGTGLFPGLSASQIAQIYSATARDTLSSSLVYGNTFASNTLTTSSLAASQINVSARSNLFSLATSNVGIGTTPVASGATLVVQGNVAVSNALTAGNVLVTRANGTTLNTASIFGPSGNVGINTTTDFGTDLYVTGNLWASNALVMQNISAPAINLTTANAISVVNWGMGIGTASIDTAQYFRGATQLVGDAPTSNTAILFPNTTGAIVNFGSATGGKVDYSTTNVFIEAWIYVPSGSTGGDILTYSNTSVGASLEMKITNNLKLQFGIRATPGPGQRMTDGNQFSAATWTHVAFTISPIASQIVCWKNGTQDSGGNITNFTTPVYIATDSLVLGDTLNPSDSFDGYIRDVRIISGGVVPITGSFTPDQAPFTPATPSYVSGGTTTFRLGILDPRTLVVQRNAFISNAITTTNVFATTANITSSGIDFVPGPVGINTTGASGTRLYVSGNLVASNALGATNVNVVTANIASGITLTTPLIIQNLGGTGNSLEVRGNAYVSNELETTNLTALTSLNTTTLNVLSISGRTGINTTLASGTSLYVSGNGYASNALVTANAFVSTFNVSRTTNTNTVELASATVRPAPDLARYLRGGATIASSGPSYAGPTLSLGGGLSSNPDAAVFGAAHPLNFDPSTSNVFIEAFIYHTDTGAQSFKTIFTIGDPNRSVGSNQPIQFTVDSGYRLNAYWRVGATGYNLIRQQALSSSTWYHVACAFDVVNSTVNLFLNGAGPTTDTILGPLVSGPLNFSAAIGASQNSGNKYAFLGYISDVRVMRGGTVPTASFTAPTAPGTFSTAAPSYFAGGTTIFTLSDYMTPRLGANLMVGGNVIASNAITTTNLNTISSTNVSALGNVSIVSGASVVLVRGVYANTALGVGANVVVSNGLTVSNIFGTRINTATLNTSSLFGNVGVNTTADRGTGLFVFGNLFMSNVTTRVPNVYATTSVNTSTQINTASIFGPSGFVGVNTTAASGTTLYVEGNLFMSNVTTAVTNVYATTSVNTSSRINTASIFSPSGFVGVNTTAASGTALYLPGNLYVSNTLSAPTLNVVTANATTTNVSAIFGPSGSVGLNTTAASGTDLYVQGNLYASNTLSTPGTLTERANAATIVATSGSVGVGTTTIGGANLYVRGNLHASNALTAPTLNVVTANTTTTNVTTLSGNVGINTTAASGTTLYVQGNLYASNALTVPNLNVTTINTTTTNVTAIFGPSGFVGLNTTTASGTTLYVRGNLYASNALTATNINVVTANTTTTNVSTIFGPSEFVGINTTAASGTDLYVLGNLHASNALTGPRLVVTTANSTTTNVSGIFGPSGSVGLNTTAASGTDLYILGNLYASNALTAPNINVVTANATTTNVLAIFGPAGYVGVNTTDASGTDLYINGNLFISNSLSTPDVLTATINASSTFNASTLVTQYVNAAALGWSNTNIFVANSITTTNIFATNVNASGYWSTSGFIGVNTTDASGATLYVDGNVAAANVFLNVPSVLGDPWIYYNEDVTKRYPHLLPTPSNAASIQNWISATCNAASQPTEGWWSSSPLVTTGNIVYTGTALTDSWSQSLLLPDGRVLIVPEDYSNVGFFNPFTNEFSKVPVTGMPTGTEKWRSGVLTPNGNVVFVPYAQSNVGVFNPISYQYSNISAGLNSTGSIWFQGAVLAPNGNVICVPRDSPNICVVDPTTFTASNVGPIAADAIDLFSTGVLLPNGNVVFAPLNSANIGMFNPSTRTYSNVGPIKSTGAGSSLESACLAPDGNIIMVPYNSGNAVVYNPSYVSSPLSPGAFSNIIVGGEGGSKFYGAVLAPTGNIICMPYNSDNVGMIDPVALTFSNVVPYNGAAVCRRGVLIPDGRIIAPRNEANVIYAIGGLGPVSTEFCLSPYLNKW